MLTVIHLYIAATTATRVGLHGFPSQCIHQAQSNDVQLTVTSSGTIEEYYDDNHDSTHAHNKPPTRIFHPRLDECVEYAQSLLGSNPYQTQDWLAWANASFQDTTVDIASLTAIYSLDSVYTIPNPSKKPIFQWGLSIGGHNIVNRENIINKGLNTSNINFNSHSNYNPNSTFTILQPLITYCGASSSSSLSEDSYSDVKIFVLRLRIMDNYGMEKLNQLQLVVIVL